MPPTKKTYVVFEQGDVAYTNRDLSCPFYIDIGGGMTHEEARQLHADLGAVLKAVEENNKEAEEKGK